MTSLVIEAMQQADRDSNEPALSNLGIERRDAFLAKLPLETPNAPVGPHPSASPHRCSDKGVLEIDEHAYLELLDWSARQSVPGKLGSTSTSTPSVLQRLGLDQDRWNKLMSHFEQAFVHLAGRCDRVESSRSHLTFRRFRVSPLAKKLLPSAA